MLRYCRKYYITFEGYYVTFEGYYVTFLFSDQHKFDCLTALAKILRQSQNQGPKHPMRPAEVVYNIKKIGSHFMHGRQECAHEFTRLFMDSLLRSSVNGKGKLDKYEEATTLPHRIFGGWTRSRVTCMNCRHNSDTYESFLDMPLEIKVCSRKTIT